MRIRILQWNVWLQEKVEAIVETLKEIDADILCLQELTAESPFNPGVHMPQRIGSALRMDYVYQPASRKPDRGAQRILGNGIFSRFPIRSGRFEFVHGPMLSRGGRKLEGRVYVEAGMDVDGSHINVGTVHLTHGYEANPEEQELERERLLAIVGKNRRHFILCADLNRSPDDPLVTSLQQSIVHCGPPFDQQTWTRVPHDFNGTKIEGLKWRLDYVFATLEFDVRSAEILEVSASDHLPILVEVMYSSCS